MNFKLFKQMLKKNWIIIIGFTAFILFELLVCIFMFEDIAGLGAMVDMLGISGDDVLAFSVSLMPSICVMFPLVLYVLLIYRVVYRPIDSTSLSAHLSIGIKRTTYLITAWVFIAASLAAVFAIVFVAGGLSMLKWGAFNWAIWLYAIVSIFLANLAVASVSFFLCSKFAPNNIAKIGMIGLPAALFLFTMMSGYIEIFRWFSITGWLKLTTKTGGISDYGNWWISNLAHIAVVAACSAASILLFRKKQLSI